MGYAFVKRPRGLREKDLLDLSIRARSRGEKLAVWLADQRNLIVLFDGKVGNELGDYNPDGCMIVPGASLVIDRTVRQSTAGAHVAGVRIAYPDVTLSYYYQKEWGRAYEQRAKWHNSTGSSIRVPFLWQVYTQMNFAHYQDAEEIDDIQKFFEAFGERVAAELDDVEPVHIPLVEGSVLPLDLSIQ